MVEIVAEISGNHGGKLGNAMMLIQAAKQVGADAVKLQCFDPIRLAQRRETNPAVLEAAKGRDLAALYAQTHTPAQWFPVLFKLADDLKIPIFSSVFDPLDVEFLEALHCPRYKISSFELGDKALLEACGKTGKPIVMSASLKAPLMLITLAVDVAMSYTPDVTLLHATGYDKPDLSGADFRRFDQLNSRFPRVGLSDHTASIGGAVAMARRGAQMIEVHLRLSDIDTPDRDFSYTPQGLYHLVKNVQRIIQPWLPLS